MYSFLYYREYKIFAKHIGQIFFTYLSNLLLIFILLYLAGLDPTQKLLDVKNIANNQSFYLINYFLVFIGVQIWAKNFQMIDAKEKILINYIGIDSMQELFFLIYRLFNLYLPVFIMSTAIYFFGGFYASMSLFSFGLILLSVFFITSNINVLFYLINQCIYNKTSSYFLQILIIILNIPNLVLIKQDLELKQLLSMIFLCIFSCVGNYFMVLYLKR